MQKTADGFTPKSRPQLLLSVQALRGMAALLVVLFHLVKYKLTQHDGTQEFLFGNVLVLGRGFIGVDVFFVISGFIMVYITQSFQRNLRDFGNFIYSRFTRIFPLWWIFAGLAAVYAYAKHGAFIEPESVYAANNQAVYLIKSLFLIPQDAPVVLSLGWTLIYEMYFYIMFAGVLCLPRQYLAWVLSLWGAVIIGAACLLMPEKTATSALTLITSPLTLEFLFGGFAALAIINHKTAKAKLIGLIGLAAFSLFLIYDFGVLARQPVWGKVMLFGLPSSFIVYGLVAAEIDGSFKTPIWSRRLGDWSYSLYLSHLFVISALAKVFIEINQRLPSHMNTIFDINSGVFLPKFIFAIIAIIASLVVSALCYQYIEKPMIGVSKKLWRR